MRRTSGPLSGPTVVARPSETDKTSSVAPKGSLGREGGELGEVTSAVARRGRRWTFPGCFVCLEPESRQPPSPAQNAWKNASP